MTAESAPLPASFAAAGVDVSLLEQPPAKRSTRQSDTKHFDETFIDRA
jgi:hypothetical protein